jgi:exopolysaccharide biosynthesis polyprenyl glycosylphosphotransferase
MNLLHSRGQRALRQLSGAILVAGLIPYLVRLVTFDDGASVLLHTQTLLIVILSTTLGYWLIRNFVAYPGVEKSSNIFTSMSTAYGSVVAALIFARIEYSRFMLMGGYVLSIAWFYWVTISSARRSRFRVGLPPFSDPRGVEDTTLVTWVRLSDPPSTAESETVDAVAVDLRADMPDAWERALADIALQGTPVYHIKHLKESLTGQVDLEHISENNFGSLSPVSAYMTLKHIVDWVAAAVALLILFPMLAACGLAIRLDSAGPALFRQRRIGYQGHAFTVYKLRTMTIDAPTLDRDAAMTKTNDARVTRIGRFLRQSRLDELPQLLNVLKGEMSWIGPRPEAEVLGKWYETEIPFYRYRHIVRPGITGWAQVNQGHVAEIDDVRTKLNYDFYYIKNFSPWLDLLIVARTIRTMLTGYGAR